MRCWAIRVFALVLLIGAAFLTPQALGGSETALADGIGVYPTDIRFEESLRGRQYFYTIGVVNGAKTDRSYSLKADGEVAQWVSFLDPRDRATVLDSLVVRGQSEGHMVMRLSIPAETANGQYQGKVTVSTAMEGEKDSGSSSGVNIGADITIQVNVTGTQRIEGSLLDVVTSDTEVGLPLLIKATLKNTGNVQVKPEIEAKVLARAKVIAEAKTTEESVQPNETKTIGLHLNTSQLAPGEHTASVAINFGGLDLGTTQLPFKALPRGTLTRQGVLDALVLVNEPIPGSVAKVNAVFRNTGEIDSRAVFVGEFFRNDVLIQAITSVERFVQEGERSVLEVFLNIPKEGRYVLKGKVNFEGKESEAKELAFEVGGKDSQIPVAAWRIAAIIGFAVVVAGVISGLRLRRRHKLE